jgi:hypothetical protein
MRTKVSFFPVAMRALAPTDEKIPKNGSITLRKVWGIGGAGRVVVVAPKLQLKREGAPWSPVLGRLRTRGCAGRCTDRHAAEERGAGDPGEAIPVTLAPGTRVCIDEHSGIPLDLRATFQV